MLHKPDCALKAAGKIFIKLRIVRSPSDHLNLDFWVWGLVMDTFQKCSGWFQSEVMLEKHCRGALYLSWLRVGEAPFCTQLDVYLSLSPAQLMDRERVHSAKHCHRHVGRDIQTSLSGDSLPQSHLQWWFCALGHLRDRKGLELVRQNHFILSFEALFRMLIVLAKQENTIDSLLTMWHTKCYPAILVSWGCCNKIAWTG